MIKDESIQIRKHSIMRYALKKVRDDDHDDVRAIRDLKNSDTPLDMLKCFYSEAQTVGQKLNKKYRTYFFKESAKRESGDRYSKSSERYADNDEGESRHRDPTYRSNSMYGRDNRDDRYYEGGRSSRYRRRHD